MQGPSKAVWRFVAILQLTAGVLCLLAALYPVARRGNAGPFFGMNLSMSAVWFGLASAALYQTRGR